MVSVPLHEPESTVRSFADRCQIESAPGACDWHDTDEVSEEVREATRDKDLYGELRP